MIDPIERKDVLDTLTEFRNGIFHDENLRRDNEHDWEAAYTLGRLHDSLYRLPRAKEKTAEQLVEHIKGWGEMTHICSECKKIVPFIDWCQPYCSGCGTLFTNYTDFQAKEPEEEEKYDCGNCKYYSNKADEEPCLNCTDKECYFEPAEGEDEQM